MSTLFTLLCRLGKQRRGWSFQDSGWILSDHTAVFHSVECSSQREYVLEALKAGKHVLLNDPVSTSMPEFVEQQTLAKKYGKFIQFSTMFVHQFQGKLDKDLE